MQGLILLDKPEGITSFGAAARIRRLAGEKRVGHTGTLDPMATGVLPMLLGRATRLSELLLTAQKEYEATLQLGLTTDTQDCTGKVLSQTTVEVTPAQFVEACRQFTGELEQVPPMFSALKQEGVRLYDLARQGIQVERAPRKITVYALEILGQPGEHQWKLRVRCSKGTYIRTLIHDLGAVLGCGAVMTALRRTETAGFPLSQCVTLAQLEADGVEAHLLPADRAVVHYPALRVSGPQANRFSHGGQLDLNRLTLWDAQAAHGDLCRVYGGETFLGLGRVNRDTGSLDIHCIIGGV